jgi:fibronectin-binding autotransporter adhesin
MKPIPLRFCYLAAIAVLGGPASLTRAASFEWNAALGLNLSWSVPANWLPTGLPGGEEDVRFFDTGAVLDLTVSSVVSANTTVHSLWLGQTNGVHNILIGPNVTLTVKGTNDNGNGPLGSDPAATDPNPNVQSTMYVGTKSEVAAGTIVNNAIMGAGGTLVLHNTNNELNVRQVFGGGGGAHVAVLDMSGLDTFRADLGRIRIGDGEAGRLRRAQGSILLAKTNEIRLSGPSLADNVQLVIGNNDVNNNGNGSVSFLVLGQMNSLSIDTILVGGRKQQGNIHFNPDLVAPKLLWRGSDGTSRIKALRIGDESDQANSGNPTTGRVDLSAGRSDIMADRIIVGKSQLQGGQSANGFLTVGAGTLDVNTLEVAFQTDHLAINPVNGTVTFEGTTVVVNDLLRLGRSGGAAPARNANLNIADATVTVKGSYQNEGTVNIGITNGLLALPASAAIAANLVTIDGGSISNASSITVTNALTLANNATIGGNPVFNMGNNGSSAWDVAGASGGGLTVSNSFRGSGTLSGNLILAPGATIAPGGLGAAGTLSIQASTSGGNLTLNSGLLRFDLSNSGTGANDQIAVSGTVTATGTSDVHLTASAGAFDTTGSYTLISSGTLNGNAGNFRVAGGLAQSRYTFTFDSSSTPNALKLSVGGSGPSSLTWVGGASGETWDLKGAANWNSGNQFFSLDAVAFNDSGSPSVVLAGALNPGPMTVNNPTKAYAFTGSGAVQGAPFTKDGAAALTFSNTGDNSFGNFTVQNGAVTLSNSGRNSFNAGLAVRGGSLVLSGNSVNEVSAGAITISSGAALVISNANANKLGSETLQLDGSLTVNQTADSTLDVAITGAGTLTKAGSGTLTLANDNSGLSSVIQVGDGTLRAGTPTSLGSAGVNVAAGGKLNLSGQNLSAVAVTASGAGLDGAGAIVNIGAPQANAFGGLTLTGDTTFGGSGPWNTDPVLNFGFWAIRNGELSTGNQPRNLVKTGGNQTTLADLTVDAALADIDVQQGLLSFDGATTSMGDPTKTMTVRSGATLSFSNTGTPWDKKFVLFGNGSTSTLFNYNGANTVAGPITLNGNVIVSAAPPDRGAPESLTLNGTISGSGGLTKPSIDTLVLTGTNTYTGDTVINAGTVALSGGGSIGSSANITVNTGATLDVSSRADSTLTLGTGQTIKGSGTINGNLTAGAGSTIISASDGGVLSVSGNATLNGKTLINLIAGSQTSGTLKAAKITFGGSLDVALTGTVTNGSTFKLFEAGTYAGAFATVSAGPGASLLWDTSTLATDGILRVKGGATLAPQLGGAMLLRNNLVFNGTGGTPGGVYHLLTSTNVTLPLNLWSSIATNSFDASGSFSLTNSVDANSGAKFFVIRRP